MNVQERVVGITGSVSGAASVLGSWQVCHSVCLAIIAFLGLLGITIVGMPLAFLTTIAVPLWLVAVVLLGVTALLYFMKRCVPVHLLLLNTGLVTAGVPFSAVEPFRPVFWIVGGGVAAGPSCRTGHSPRLGGAVRSPPRHRGAGRRHRAGHG